MTLRGVAAVEGMVNEGRRQQVEQALANRLLPFCREQDGLAPFLPAANAADIPVKWSTLPGSHQLKAAASLRFSRTAVARSSIQDAIAQIGTRWKSHTGTAEEWHAGLYFIEGLILAAHVQQDAETWRMAADNYRALAARWWEALEGAGRSDVIAQLLRAGCILRGQGCLTDAACLHGLDRLPTLLGKFIDDDGAVSFRPLDSGAPRHWNAWSALFAHQALCFHEAVMQEGRIASNWLELMV
jgi:hypothetical protein